VEGAAAAEVEPVDRAPGTAGGTGIEGPGSRRRNTAAGVGSLAAGTAQYTAENSYRRTSG